MGHDALCVIRCLVKKRFLIAGGGAPETEISRELMLYANTLTGADAYCFKGFAEALEIIPYTLSENAGLNPIGTVTELRNKHAQGEKTAGINVRKGCITNILEENVVQPLLVSTSSITLLPSAYGQFSRLMTLSTLSVVNSYPPTYPTKMFRLIR